MEAVRITTRLVAHSVDLDDTDPLPDMQKAVGGNIEAVHLEEDVTMWVNEEGMLMDLPLNWTASILAGKTILGDVVVTSISPSGVHLRPVPSGYRRQISWCLMMQCSGDLPGPDLRDQETTI